MATLSAGTTSTYITTATGGSTGSITFDATGDWIIDHSSAGPVPVHDFLVDIDNDIVDVRPRLHEEIGNGREGFNWEEACIFASEHYEELADDWYERAEVDNEGKYAFLPGDGLGLAKIIPYHPQMRFEGPLSWVQACDRMSNYFQELSDRWFKQKDEKPTVEGLTIL